MSFIQALHTPWTLTRSRVSASPNPVTSFDALLHQQETAMDAANPAVVIRTNRTREQINDMLSQGMISRTEVGLFSLLMLQAENGHGPSGAFLSSLRMKTTLTAWSLQGQAQGGPGGDAATLISWWALAQEVDACGFVNVGSDQLWTFPHPRASPTVQGAWREITQQLSEQTKQFRVAMFLARLFEANVGEARLLRSGEPGFRNPFGDGLFTLHDMLSGMIQDLDRISSVDLQQNRDEQTGFLQEFRQALERRGVGSGKGLGFPLF
ncbi:MAG: hypothetical protein HQL51_06250 [Magnetococcales bacterium]|nr:hypothetical protein [Magnetococcales bacterium]